jgi:magnesium transporter
MICTYLYNTQHKQLELLTPEEMMEQSPNEEALAEKNSAMRERKFKGAAFRGKPRCHPDQFMWVDVTDPTPEDFAMLARRFGLHPLVMEDIKAKEGRPKLHNYSDYLYLIFFAVQWRERSPHEAEADGTRFELHMNEIDCLVGADFIVTIHPEPIAPFDDLRDRWLRRPEMMKSGTGYLLYEIMDEVLDDYFPLLDALDERIDEFEEALFENEKEPASRRLSSQIFALKRSLISIRRVAGPTRDVVNILLRHDADSGGKNFAYYQDLYDHSSRIVDMIDNFREIVAGALDAYLATESNRMNQVMKTLTACSIILLVPNLIAAVYGMNFDDLPKSHGFWGSLGAMAALVAGLFGYFKHLKWL